jgi:plasmid stabilization system protein ParE
MYLEAERPSFGRLFLDAYAKVLERIARAPESGAPTKFQYGGQAVRSFAIRRFGYAVITARHDDTSVIVAVPHARRRPGYWLARLPKR